MPDITICKAILPDGSFCKDKDRCYRYLIDSNLLEQSYTQYLRESNNISCEYFIDYATKTVKEVEP